MLHYQSNAVCNDEFIYWSGSPKRIRGVFPRQWLDIHMDAGQVIQSLSDWLWINKTQFIFMFIFMLYALRFIGNIIARDKVSSGLFINLRW